MKTLIITIWVLATGSSAGSISDKRGIGISSGYGGAYENYGHHIRYGYSATPSFVSVNSPLQSSVANSGSYGGAYAHSPTSTDVGFNEGLQSSVAISSGYGRGFGYISLPKVDSDIKNFTESLDISNNNGEANGNSSVLNTEDLSKELQTGAPVSSPHDGATDGPLLSVVSDMKHLQSSDTFSNGYSESYGSPATSKIIGENSNLQSGIFISSGYGGSYGYAPLPSVSDSKNLKSGIGFPSVYGETNSHTVSGYKDLSSSLPVSSGYGGAYGYAIKPIIDNFNDVINPQKGQHISPEFAVLKMESMVDLPSYSTGFSGYGSAISSYSGYSRSPRYPGYGFAYASGWL